MRAAAFAFLAYAGRVPPIEAWVDVYINGLR